MDLSIDDPAVASYYDDLLDLFIHPGWRLFVEGVKADHDAIQAEIHQLKTVEQLHRFHGVTQVYRQVLDFEAVIRARLDLLSKEGGSLDEPLEAFEDII